METCIVAADKYILPPEKQIPGQLYFASDVENKYDCGCGVRYYVSYKEIVYHLTASLICGICQRKKMWCMICGHLYYPYFDSLSDRTNHISEAHSMSFTPWVSDTTEGFYISTLTRNDMPLYVKIPAYMSMLVIPEYDFTNIYDIWIKTIGDGNEKNILDRHKYANMASLEYFLRQLYSCSICGKVYDTVSKEVCEKHIRDCVRYTPFSRGLLLY
jgi:hypothetical protein